MTNFYITYHKVLDYIESFQEQSPIMNSFGYGNLVDFGRTVSGDTQNAAVEYPFLFAVPINISYNENTTEYQMSLIFADILNTDLMNEKEVISDMSLQARRFISYIKRGIRTFPELYENFDLELPIQAIPFMERFGDHVAGVAIDINLIVFEDINACDYYEVVPSPTPSITPTTTPTNTPTITPTSTLTPTPTTTATPTLTPTPSSSPAPTFDADAAAYLSAVISGGGTGITSTISAATNTLFTSLKSNGLYTKMTLMYPMIGATSGSTIVNAKNPGTYNINWINQTGISFDPTGVKGNGTSNYGVVNGLDVASLNPNNTHFSQYIYTGSSYGGYDTAFGENQGGYGGDGIWSIYGDGGVYAAIGRGGSYSPSGSTPAVQVSSFVFGPYDGYKIFNRTSSTLFNVFSNGVKVAEVTGVNTNPVLTSNSLGVLASKSGVNPQDFFPEPVSFITLGTSLTDAQAATLETIINTFQTSLSRNTY